jgi:hypothetical protein
MRPVKALVDRGLEIVADQARLDKELKKIVAELEAHGLNNAAQHEDLADADRDGKRWFAKGSELEVPMIFTADKIVSEFVSKSPKRVEIEQAAGDFFRHFFKPVNGFANLFKDGKKFRAQAQELLGDKAPAFITACLARGKDGLPKSDIKIQWADAKEVQS